MKFSKILTPIESMNRMQDQLAQVINPIAGNPIVQGIFLTNVNLINGLKKVDHTLGRNLLGWTIVRQRGAAQIYDEQDSNLQPNLTLSLVSNAAVSVDLYVF